jgi:hypothetical protein
VTGIEAELRPLAEREQPAGQRRITFDPDQRLRSDQVACGAEQGMAALDRLHFDTDNLVHRALQDRRIDHLNAAAIRAEAALSDN